MPRRPYDQLHVGAVLDADRLLARLERLRTVRRQVFRRIGRIDGLDEEVLHVGVRGREAPGDGVVLPEQNAGQAGHGGALDRALGRDDAGEIPEDRRLEAEVRIVGEDRLSSGGARSGDHPLVRRPVADADQGADLVLDALGFRVRLAPGRQRRDRGAGRRPGKHPGRLVRAELLAKMGAQRLELIVVRQLERNQLAPDERVGGLPRFGPVADDEELGRQRVLVAVEEGVHAVCIGREALLRPRAQRAISCFPPRDRSRACG